MRKGTIALNAKTKLLRAAVWLTQLGVSILAPPVLLLLLAVWLQERYGWGNWVLIAAIISGILSSFCSMLAFYRVFVKKNRKPDERPPAFNGHE